MPVNNEQGSSCNTEKPHGTCHSESNNFSIHSDQTIKIVTLYIFTGWRGLLLFTSWQSLRAHLEGIWKTACYIFDAAIFVLRDRVA